MSGRKPEHFPEARERDRRILAFLTEMDPGSGLSRNELVEREGSDPGLIRYSLNRLRAAGRSGRGPRVEHIKKGNEGHGYWAVAETETTT